MGLQQSTPESLDVVHRIIYRARRSCSRPGTLCPECGGALRPLGEDVSENKKIDDLLPWNVAAQLPSPRLSA